MASARVEGHWDPDQIVTVLSNLVENAVEYGAGNKTIRIRVHAVDDSAVIEVSGAGPALDDGVMARLFEPFNCGRARRTDGMEGLGLGLYLASEIVRAHAGRIDVRNDSTKGPTFRVTMPRA